MSNLLRKYNPTLNIKDITDIYVRKNFENLRDYFSNENQLLGFKFFELVFPQAVSNYRFPHGLKTIPQDIIVTQITGQGEVKFNNFAFDISQAEVTATGPCRIRFFMGTYWNYQGKTGYNAGDEMSFGTVAASAAAVSGRSTLNQVHVPLNQNQLASGAYPGSNFATYAIRPGIDDVIYVNGSGGYTLQLPPAASCTGRVFTIYRTDNSINRVPIQCNLTNPDYIEEALSEFNSQPIPVFNTTPDLSQVKYSSVDTWQERIQIVSTGSYFRVLSRDYFRGWIMYPTALRTNAHVNNVTLNTGTGYVAPALYYRRDGKDVHYRFGFRNGTGGAATGTAGSLTVGLLPLPFDTRSRTTDGAIGASDGAALTTLGGVYKGLENIYMLVSSGQYYAQIQNSGISGYYTLANVGAGFALEAKATNSIMAWRG